MPTQNDNTFYVTTPIYYVNDKPHLGHVYTTMVADVVARYHRLKGDDTFFLTGVDEHAAKVSDKAAEHGLSPQEWADQNAAAFRETFEKLEMSNDDFVRTSSARHKEKVTEYVQALIASGDVYEGEYVGWYDAGQEEYVPENKAKAQDYKSDVNGKPLVKKAEKNYFFKLGEYREALLAFYEKRDEAGQSYVQPEARKNEIINRIKDAKDIPISRTGSGGWGIPVPGDEEQTIYVWIDALFNYLTYVDDDERRKYWEAGACHFIAKDILWFHAAIWPAIQMALAKCDGYDWVWSENVAAKQLVYSHSYWVSASGEKMSKTLGNFLDPAAIDNYVDEFGLDALRYFLATRGPLGTTDSAFSPDLFVEVYNSDLANTFGNSFSRVSNMIGKYFEGVLPRGGPHVPLGAVYEFDVYREEGQFDHRAKLEFDTFEERNAYSFESLNLPWNSLNLGLASMFGLGTVAEVDSYIERSAPFRLAKDPDKLPEVGTILYNCLEALRIASVLLWPFIPEKCEAFWSRIGFGHYAEQLKDNGRGDLAAWVEWGQLKAGTPIEKGDALFPRYQVEKK